MTKHLYAILSDIHGNHNALLEIGRDARQLARSQNLPVPQFIFLGDAVDYGPEPNEVMKWLEDNKPLINVIGNHDAEAIADRCRRPTRVDKQWWPMTLWTRLALKDVYQDRLASWPTRVQANNSLSSFLLFHSDTIGKDNAPNAPERAEKVLQDIAKTCNTCSYGLFGHTHYQVLYVKERDKNNHYRKNNEGIYSVYAVPENESERRGNREGFLQVNKWHEFPSSPALINPGSVGQPRFHLMQTASSGDIRASYLLFYSGDDGEYFQWRRVAYDVEGTIKSLRSLEMPETNSHKNGGKDVLRDNSPAASRQEHPAYFNKQDVKNLKREFPSVIERLTEILLNGG